MKLMTLSEHKKKLEVALREISTATDYTENYLMHGNGCDSSEDQSLRINYVLKAEKMFVEQHKKEILMIAARLVEEEIKEAYGSINY